MNDKSRGVEVGSSCRDDPADDGHATIGAIEVDASFSAEVVIEMDLIPRFLKAMKTRFDRLDPDGPRTPH